MYFDAEVVFVTSHSLLFRLALAILCRVLSFSQISNLSSYNGAIEISTIYTSFNQSQDSRPAEDQSCDVIGWMKCRRSNFPLHQLAYDRVPESWKTQKWSWIYKPIRNERENVYSKFLLMKSLKKWFNFLPAFYLIIWLMISPKNFGKIGILKIWQLVSLWGVKTHFGKK